MSGLRCGRVSSRGTGFLAAVSELDIARYNLLAKTGRLLDSLDINPSEAPRK